MKSNSLRNVWISYLRVSTTAQAERDLSLPAQRDAISRYARNHDLTIAREYVESGASGTNAQRPEFRRLLEDVFRPHSDVATIVVHHTSRFTRDATEARVIKRKLTRAGVRVLSVCQDLQDDPIGRLMEGFFECIDQYESEINGLRTAAAMREAVRQGFFPGSFPPHGFQRCPVELRPGVVRYRLVPHEDEAEVVREIFRMYICENGAKAVARALNRQSIRYRTGVRWNNKLVLNVLDQSAAVGNYLWGRHVYRPRQKKGSVEPLILRVEPIVENEVFNLAQRLRRLRDPKKLGGNAISPARLLSGLLRCGYCGASCQLETSGKRVDNGFYRYCYYNCRSACRIGSEACSGFRISTAVLDRHVIDHIAKYACTVERAKWLARNTQRGAAWQTSDTTTLASKWRDLIVSHRQACVQWARGCE